jgi:hypothetical protein
MPQNFLECGREQAFLMPPDPRDWLPEGHLAWFVLASVERLDLAAFYASYGVDGWGRAAFEPQMMVSLLLYAYARGGRSSRGIERRCVEDVAYRVIAAHEVFFTPAERETRLPAQAKCEADLRRRPRHHAGAEGTHPPRRAHGAPGPVRLLPLARYSRPGPGLCAGV